MSKEKEKLFKFVRNVVDVVDSPNEEICEPLLWNNVDLAQSRNEQVQFIARRKEEKKIQKIF